MEVIKVVFLLQHNLTHTKARVVLISGLGLGLGLGLSVIRLQVIAEADTRLEGKRTEKQEGNVSVTLVTFWGHVIPCRVWGRGESCALQNLEYHQYYI